MSTNTDVNENSQEEQSARYSSPPVPQRARGRPRGRPRGSRGRPRLKNRGGPDHATISTDLSTPAARPREVPPRGRPGRKRGRPRLSDRGIDRSSYNATTPSSPPANDTPASRPRRRATNKEPKYSTDAFEIVGIEPDIKLEEDTDEDRGVIRALAHARDEDDDDEYEDRDVDDGDDETTFTKIYNRPRAQSLTSAYSTLTQRKPYKSKTNFDTNLSSVTPDNPLGNHSRGLPKYHSSIARPIQLRLAFGDNESDLRLITHVCDLWSGPQDSTFPQRASLAAVVKYMKGTGSGRDPFDIRLQEESSRGWGWHSASLHRNPCRQRLRQLAGAKTAAGDAEVRKYLPVHKGKMRVLMGPSSEQKLYEVEQGDAYDFSDAFATSRPRNPQLQTTANSAKPRKNARPSTPSLSNQPRRKGWLLNLGSKVQCLDWAPNCSDGKNQYLAVAVPVTDAQKVNPEKAPTTAPAFTPSAPHPAAIQIWSFAGKFGKNDSNVVAKLDMSKKPKLCQVICTDAGDIRRLSWCPCPRQTDNEDGRLGLLAGLWSDGSLKVVDVKLSEATPERERETEYLHLDTPFFKAKIPGTICTSFSWLSPSDIVVGHSNGFISLWNIATQFRKPNLYTPVHTTYILEISSAYPISPDLVATASMDGHVQLTSLSDPSSDVANAPRSRITSACLTYCPQLQAFFTSDESDYLRMYPQRRIFSSTAVCKATSSISAISRGSLRHPIMLYGSVGGDAVITNPLSRALTARGRHFEQRWFCYEWLRQTTATADTNTTNAGASEDDYAPGISKFTDIFPAEPPVLLAAQLNDKRTLNGVAGLTIFEEATALTGMSWNPNARCAGWAAVGMGSGLVRVEDLAIG